ncbi:cupin domain-containing protein [Streptomyces sp. NBC_00637]|uniref:cupin domain-containing protein n=1 Tax=Streptomyces sp. NBC_00637 TaxID=2903667 RepID=UPI00324C56A8
MIITTTGEAVRTAVDTAAEADWTCLVRRGMLHSECEAVEHWRLAPGAVLAATPRHGVEEAVLVLEGELGVSAASGEHSLGAGQLVLFPHGCAARLTAGSDPVRLISVRTLAAAVTDRLPPRVPELLRS